MQRLAKWPTAALVLLVLVSPCLAETMKDAATTLPGGVLAALFVGNLKNTDADYRTVIEGMGLTEFVPESQREPLARLKEKLPGLTGFDENGSIAILILKSASLPEIMSNVAVLLPASDPARLLNDLGGDPVKPDDDKVRSVLLFGQTMYASATARHVAVAKTADVARRVSQQKTTLRERLSAHEIESLEKLDAAIWLDTSALISIFRPQIDGLMGWALMMQMGAGEVGEEEARASKKQIDTVLEGLASLLIGTTLSEQGVGLRVTASTKPGSEMAKQTQHVLAASPLLRGLPRRNYLAVFGQELHPIAVRAALTAGLDPVFAALRKEGGLDREKIGTIQKETTQALELIRAVRGSVDHLSAGVDGMFAASLIIETTDSAAWLELAKKTSADVAALVLAESEKKEDADEKKTLEKWVKWKPDAEQLEGVNVSRLFVDVLSDEELEEEEIEGIKTILGPEGMTLRLAAVNQKNVALTVGGGSAQMARLIRAIRRDLSPLDDEQGIVRVASHLPKERAGVYYLACDRIVNFIHCLAEVSEPEEPFPFWLPRLDAPLAISVTGGEGWSRNDLFAPMPLLAGMVTAVRTMESYDDSDDEGAADDGNADEDHDAEDSNENNTKDDDDE